MFSPTEKEIAATYNPPSYVDAWQCVQDYQRVLEHTAKHPNQGSSAVANRLGLPRGRVRPWMNDSVPDVVRGIQTAEAHGWLHNYTTNETKTALVQLAAWALTGGSITLSAEDGARVYFSLDHNDGQFADIANAAGIEYDIINADTTKRATEARPTTDGSVLARVLLAMGIPESYNKQTIASLPAFVENLDGDQRRSFAKILILNRAATHPNKATLTIRIERPDSYLDDLVELLADVTSKRVTRTGKTITVSADAARKLKGAIGIRL